MALKMGMIRFAVMVDNTIIGESICLTKPGAATFLPGIKAKADPMQHCRVVRLNVSEIRSRVEAKKLAAARYKRRLRRETPEMKDHTG